MRRRIFWIKFAHSVAFWFMLACFVYNIYAAATDTFNWVLFITVGTHLVEGAVLIFNRWTCPLRTMAEKYGAEKGQITDIFLPRWLADRLFPIGLGLFVVEVVWLGISFVTR